MAGLQRVTSLEGLTKAACSCIGYLNGNCGGEFLVNIGGLIIAFLYLEATVTL